MTSARFSASISLQLVKLGFLLLKNLHNSVLNSVAQFWMRDAVLEILLGVGEVAAVGVVLGTEDHHHAGKVSAGPLTR